MDDRVVDREAGSVLVLMPAAVLVFLVLGAIAVDFAGVHLAERQVANAAAAAANDAASAGLDLDRFYATGDVVLDPGEVRSVAARSVAGAGLERLDGVTVSADVGPGVDQVTVTVEAAIGHLFADALPGGPDATSVSARATATAELDR